jgi:hypothetical protein
MAFPQSLKDLLERESVKGTVYKKAMAKSVEGG